MEKFATIINLLKQRRIWIAIIAMVGVGSSTAGHALNIDQGLLADSLVRLVGQISDVVITALAIWSFVSPKK